MLVYYIQEKEYEKAINILKKQVIYFMFLFMYL